jgi:hypothetical protein
MEGTQWWLWVPEPGILLWARLRLREDTGAEVLESSGLTLRFDDLDGARHYLLSADYRALDGLDVEDFGELGLPADGLEPPQGDHDRELVPRMTQRIA